MLLEQANKAVNIFGGPLKKGDRVVLYPWITCGKCRGCLTYGFRNLYCMRRLFCIQRSILYAWSWGVEGISSNVEMYPHFKGGFAEYLYVSPETYMWKLPEDMPSEVAVLLDPLAVAVRAVELTCMSPGVVEEAFTTSATVAVIGDGPVGALTALVARLMGVEKIILIGSKAIKCRLCAKLS